jgi:arylsulfatase A-like enzyme
VVVTIDTLRADHLGCYGYFRDTSPTLDALAERSVLFRHAVTTIATTLPAHVALFTSRYPLETGVVSTGRKMVRRRQAGSSIRFFAELLAAMGYRTTAFVSATPVKKSTGLDAGFGSFDEPEIGGRKARQTTDAVLAWLATPPAEPFFLWVHYFDPHAPYEPPPEHDRFSTEPQLLEFLRAKGVPEPPDPEVLSANNLYDGEIHSVDSQIARLIARLEELEQFDALTFVVLGDHGEALGQHDRIGHGEIYNEELFVPLIIKFPAGSRLDGTVVESLVSLVDVVPTLVGRLALPVPEADRVRFSGSDVLQGGAQREHALAQRAFGPPRKWGPGEKFALVALDWKYVLETRRPDELYHLVDDPGERTNLVERERERADRLRRQLLEEIAERTRRADRMETVEETSPKVVEELRSLGYIQ